MVPAALGLTMGNKKQQAVRIIAGELKGRRLSYPPGKELRPTMQRTRESLFNSLGARVEGRVFADLFAAAGGVGIEALSRGASLVHFVENDPAALECLRRNIDACRIGRDRYRIHPVTVERFIESGGPGRARAQLVFADPPYGAGTAGTVVAHFDKNDYDFLELLVIEHSGVFEAGSLERLVVEKTRRFGDTYLTFLSPPGR